MARPSTAIGNSQAATRAEAVRRLVERVRLRSCVELRLLGVQRWSCHSLSVWSCETDATTCLSFAVACAIGRHRTRVTAAPCAAHPHADACH